MAKKSIVLLPETEEILQEMGKICEIAKKAICRIGGRESGD